MTRTLALAVLVCLSGSRPGVQTIPALVAANNIAGPTEESDPGHRTPPPMVAPVESGSPTGAKLARPAATVLRWGTPAVSMWGIASWGRPWAGVVTRLPRGTRICVTGPLGRWCGPSVGYGPAKWTGRIADLSASVFTAICGPLSRGLCRVTMRKEGAAA